MKNEMPVKGETYHSLYFDEINIEVTSVIPKRNTVYAVVTTGYFNVGKKFSYNLNTFFNYYEKVTA